MSFLFHAVSPDLSFFVEEAFFFFRALSSRCCCRGGSMPSNSSASRASRMSAGEIVERLCTPQMSLAAAVRYEIHTLPAYARASLVSLATSTLGGSADLTMRFTTALGRNRSSSLTTRVAFSVLGPELALDDDV